MCSGGFSTPTDSLFCTVQRRPASQPTLSTGLPDLSAVNNQYGPTATTSAVAGNVTGQLIQQNRVVEAPGASVTGLQQLTAPHVTYTMGAPMTVGSHLQAMPSNMVTGVSQSNPVLSATGANLVQPESQTRGYLRGIEFIVLECAPDKILLLAVLAVTSSVAPSLPGITTAVPSAPVSTVGMLPISTMSSLPIATRTAPVSEVPVYSTMMSSFPPSFDAVSTVRIAAAHRPPPSLPAASAAPSSAGQATAATPTAATEEQQYMEKVESITRFGLLWY